MRTASLVTVLLLLLLCSTARADVLRLSIADTMPTRGVELEARHELARRRISSGKSLTTMALVHLALGGALGIAMITTGSKCSPASGCTDDGGLSLALMIPSVLFTGSGVLFASIGVPMWAVGAHDERRTQTTISAGAGGMTIHF